MEKELTTKKSKKTVLSEKNKDIKTIAKKAIKELERIAFSEEEPVKIRMDILKWFTELGVGKARAQTEECEKENKSFNIKVSVED